MSVAEIDCETIINYFFIKGILVYGKAHTSVLSHCFKHPIDRSNIKHMCQLYWECTFVIVLNVGHMNIHILFWVLDKPQGHYQKG